MKKKRGCLFGCLSILIILILLLVVEFQYRHFYKVGNMDFTFWKTGKGCYIMPYKYWGVTIPKDNYMKAPNKGGVIIFIGEDTTLYIFPDFVSYSGVDTIECNLSLYKYKHFPYINEIEHIKAMQDMRIYLKSCGYPYIEIYLLEMYAQIRNTPQLTPKTEINKTK